MDVSKDLRAELLAVALDVAREAGELLVSGYGGTRTVDTKSSPTDIVTEMDHAAERLITAELARRRPGDGILGEEGADSAGDSGVRWVVDPLDGTVNYLYGLGGWAVSVAAEVDGVVVAGVVARPVRAGDVRRHPRRRLDVQRRTAAPRRGPGARRGPGRDRVRLRRAASRAPGRRAGPGAAAACGTSAGSGPALSTCARSRPAGSTRTTSAASSRGTTRRAVSSPAKPVCRSAGCAGRRSSDRFLLAAPPALFALLHDVLAEAGADDGDGYAELLPV